MRARACVVFRGRVQGVNFRAHCRENALDLGLTGWVRNRSDGTVEAMFEGERGVVERAIEWNCTSQPSALVTDRRMEWSEATGEFRSFEIRR
ncbi:MAG TPA: acylphosphatase [Thermoplasmata archaeon]|nr:acylphosphatase [Thermoplasmata archaeon]